MVALAAQRCDYHAQREAVARCPACQRYFCRECITEHAGRVLCTTCLHKLLQEVEGSRQGWHWGARGVCCVLSFTLLWLCFYWLAQVLVSFPELLPESPAWHEQPGGQR